MLSQVSFDKIMCMCTIDHENFLCKVYSIAGFLISSGQHLIKSI